MAWVASVALHAGLLLGLALRPSAPSPPAPPLHLRLLDGPSESFAGRAPPVAPTPKPTGPTAPTRSANPGRGLRRPAVVPPTRPSEPAPVAEGGSVGAESGAPTIGGGPADFGPGEAPASGQGAGPDGAGGLELGIAVAPPSIALLPPAPPSAPAIQLAPKAGGGFVYRDRGFSAEIDHDGTVRFRDHAPVALGGESTGGVPVATFDLTEAIMMIAGDDPYRTEKEHFLAATQTLRQDLCSAAHEERLKSALYDLDRRLSAIWNDRSTAEAARRALLFQLWDECLEPEPNTTDLTERTALQARATILGYIQKNLPAGSPVAYPPAELLALNERRRSRAPFDPYAGRADAGPGCE